jgi:3'(2'), 5'-bisphosphate nucleotidase
VWIVDPLDGTREFSEEGRTDWAVHVALWSRGAAASGDGALTAGAVAMPARGTVLGTDLPAPAGAEGPIRIAVSRTRPPAFVTQMLADLDGVGVPMGSAGVKVCAVVTGEVDAYVHGGGQYEWDSAAPVAVATATGLHTSRIDGAPLLYNRTNPRLPDLLVCRPEIAERLLQAIEATGATASSTQEGARS